MEIEGGLIGETGGSIFLRRLATGVESACKSVDGSRGRRAAVAGPSSC